MEKVAIISVDGHVRGSCAAYREYVEDKYLDAYDDWVQAVEATGRADAGNIQPALGLEAQWDVERRLSDLETQSVVAEVVFPNGIPFQASLLSDSGESADPELTRAGQTIYNRWLVDLCSQADGRICGQAAIVFDDVDQAVADIHWAKDQGLGGIMMPGLYPGGTYFFDPALDPIWAAIQDVDLPISQHGGVGAPTYTPTGLAAILTLAYEHAFFSGRSLWQMIVGGVFDRFPDLKMVFVETEARWIGPALQVFDGRMAMGDEWTEFASFLERERAFTRLPSEYWATNCFAGISPFHPNQLPIEKLGSGYTPTADEFFIGSDTAMMGVDYPHFESVYPEMMEGVGLFLDQDSVTRADVRRVLFDNAAEIYNFDREALQPHIDRVGFELGDTDAMSTA